MDYFNASIEYIPESNDVIDFEDLAIEQNNSHKQSYYTKQ